jgi:hypothetical protein
MKDKGGLANFKKKSKSIVFFRPDLWKSGKNRFTASEQTLACGKR